MKWKLALVALFFLAIGSTWIGYRYYSFIFAKTVHGEIVGVERVTQPTAIITGSETGPSPLQMFSFAIAIRDLKSGEIVTGSSEDRQWAVVQKGQCAIAKFFPYPFWELERAGTYFGTRLIQLYDCTKPE